MIFDFCQCHVGCRRSNKQFISKSGWIQCLSGPSSYKVSGSGPRKNTWDLRPWPPEMCGLRTRPRSDVDPPRLLDRTAIVGGRFAAPGAIACLLPNLLTRLLTKSSSQRTSELNWLAPSWPSYTRRYWSRASAWRCWLAVCLSVCWTQREPCKKGWTRRNFGLGWVEE